MNFSKPYKKKDKIAVMLISDRLISLAFFLLLLKLARMQSSVKTYSSLDERAIKAGYQKFKAEKSEKDVATLATQHGLPPESLMAFVNETIGRMIFDGKKLSDLLEPLDLGWRDRTKKELELMDALIPMLKKLANGREIAGLKAYE